MTAYPIGTLRVQHEDQLPVFALGWIERALLIGVAGIAGHHHVGRSTRLTPFEEPPAHAPLGSVGEHVDGDLPRHPRQFLRARLVDDRRTRAISYSKVRQLVHQRAHVVSGQLDRTC
jgi:hypothetical protein